MKCAWKELLAILPSRIRREVEGKDLWEIRIRKDRPTELVGSRGSIWLDARANGEDIRFCINTASRYSPWAAQTTGMGYLAAPGGHRLGICGEAVMKDGVMTGFRRITSVCIRVARDFPGISNGCDLSGSILILGPPGSGKGF